MLIIVNILTCSCPHDLIYESSALKSDWVKLLKVSIVESLKNAPRPQIQALKVFEKMFGVNAKV